MLERYQRYMPKVTNTAVLKDCFVGKIFYNSCLILRQSHVIFQREYVPVPWVLDYRWREYNLIPHQVKQMAGRRAITAENMEKSQHTDFNENTTNESTSMVCSNVQLWKLVS